MEIDEKKWTQKPNTIYFYEYAKIERSEIAEVIRLLITTHKYKLYLSNKFFESLELEMKLQLYWFKENTKIIKSKATKIHTVKELEYFT